MKRLLAGMVCSLMVLSVPGVSFALTGPYCSSVVSCTGMAPQITNDGKSGLTHPEIVPIFWGSYWNTGTNPSRGQMVAVVQGIVNGAYLGALNQYGDNGNGGQARMSPIAPIYTGTTIPSTVTESDVGGVINDAVTAGLVPPPAAGADAFYLVFLPPGTNTNPGNDVNYGWTVNGVGSHVGWVHDDPAGIAHEIVESIAGNIGVSNCKYLSDGSIANQIADICSCYSETQNGGSLTLPAYWSQQKGQCVIPESWTKVWQYNGAPNNWTVIGSGVRQIYAGQSGGGVCLAPPCLIATDTNDNLIEYSGTPNSWSQIGGPGAMFSLGSGVVMGMTPDGSSVYAYNGSSWSPVWTGGNISSLAAGGIQLLIDYSGSPWQYTPQNQNPWTNIGGPGDQFVVGYDWAAGLNFNRENVWLFPLNGSSGWINTGHAASELFIGGSQSLAARDLTAAGDTLAMTTSIVSGKYVPNGWHDEGGTANSVALFGNSTTPLVRLETTQSIIDRDNDPIGNSTSWGQIGGSANRVVGNGAFLYAVQGINY